MPLKIGSDSIGDIYVGSDKIGKIYVGSDLVYTSAVPYSLSISAGTGTTITVNRTSSPKAHAATGNLSNGAVVYSGDVLSVSYIVGTAYNISTHTINGSSFSSGATHTVSGNVSVVTTATVKTYTLSISAGSNTTITVNRTQSSYGGGTTGNLSNNATLYYGDSLTINYSVSSGYNISTHTVNGSTFTSGTSYTVSSNITVVTTAVVATSWHTIWTGSQEVADGTAPTSTTTRSKTITIANLRVNVPTRVTISTCNFTIVPNDNMQTLNINQALNTSCGEKIIYNSNSNPASSTETFSAQASTYITVAPSGSTTAFNFGISIDTPTQANTLPIHETTYTYKVWTSYVIRGYIKSCIITKVEQYY